MLARGEEGRSMFSNFKHMVYEYAGTMYAVLSLNGGDIFRCIKPNLIEVLNEEQHIFIRRL
jgi:hypothetical protein